MVILVKLFLNVFMQNIQILVTKISVDYSGLRELRMSEKSVFTYARYGGINGYIYSTNIPTIWYTYMKQIQNIGHIILNG